jgi:molecular chaperone HscB
MDYFEVFGLPRRLAVDGAALQRRFYELARRHHPDFHQAAPAAEQARVNEMSALVNAAYRALRDPIPRIEYLIRLEEGRGAGEGEPAKPQASAELLAEMFEIQEALQEARAGGLDEAGRRDMGEHLERLVARHREEDARLAGPLAAAWDAAAAADRPRALAALKESLARRAYLRTVIDDLREALGEERPGHVAHHRH